MNIYLYSSLARYWLAGTAIDLSQLAENFSLSLSLSLSFPALVWSAARAAPSVCLYTIPTRAPSSRRQEPKMRKKLRQFAPIFAILLMLTPVKKAGKFYKNNFSCLWGVFGALLLFRPRLFSMASIVWLAGGGKRCSTGFTCSITLVAVTTRSLFSLYKRKPKKFFRLILPFIRQNGRQQGNHHVSQSSLIR